MLEEVIWLNNFETLNTTFDLQHGISHNMFQEDVPSIQQRKGNSTFYTAKEGKQWARDHGIH